MFEHLNEQNTLPWRDRIRYFAAASIVVAAVFFLSLWMIAKAANYFGVALPFRPVEVTYDANEDGLLLNEIAADSGDIPATESEKASPPPSATTDEKHVSPPHEADAAHGHHLDRSEHSPPPESHSQTRDP